MKTKINILLSFLIFFSFQLFAQKEIKQGSSEYYDMLIQQYQQKREAFVGNEKELLNITKNIKALELAKEKAEITRGESSTENDTTTSEAGGSICSEAAPFCSNGIYNFVAKEGPDAESGPDYGCLGTQHNPTWYFMRIKTDGDVVMNLQSPQDLDFIIWGPFSSVTCDYSDLSTDNIVDCSYSSLSEETPEIGPNSSEGATTAHAGEYYMFLITMNVTHPDSALKFQLTQTDGTGVTDCSIICPLYENLSQMLKYLEMSINVL